MRRQAILVGVAASVLAACGSPAGQDQRARQEVPSELAAAATRSEQAGSARVVMRMRQEIEGFDEPVLASGFGVVDAEGQRARLVLEMGKTPIGDLGTAHIVLDGLMLYTKSSYMNSVMPHGNPWLMLDLDAVGDAMGVDMGSVMQLGGQDPAQMLGYLRGAGEVEKLGTATVNGVETTHYSALIEYRRVAELAPPEDRDRVASAIERLIELTGQETAPAEVWIDDRGLVRRLKLVMDMTEVDPSLGAPPSMTTQVTDFVQYGVRARIKVPPPSRVTDMMQFIDEELGGDFSG